MSGKQTNGHRYVIATDDGGEYSADAADYFMASDTAMLGALVRLDHPYRTTSGRWVLAPRLIKNDVTVRDLRRLSTR